MDTLFVNELKVSLSIGIHPHEKQALQEVWITLTLSLDLSKAKQSDRIEDTLNYDELVACVYKVAQQKHFHLIEHFAFCCQREILKHFSMISGCKVRVEKPTALPQAKSSAVEIQ